MLDIAETFRGRKANVKALLSFGFVRLGGAYVYNEDILNAQFSLTVRVKDNAVSAEVYDKEAENPYYLFAVEGAEGAFVGEVRAEYDRILTAVSEKCFSRAEVYREKTAQAVIKYAKNKYGTPLEFLWEDENSVMRRKDNRKWYVAFLVVDGKKLFAEGEGKIEICDVRAPKEEIQKVTDGVNYLPAYHMNKKSWLTIPLDGRVSHEIICAFLDISYELASGKKSK